MLFRNLLLYRLPEGWSISASQLEELLSLHPLQPCGGFDMQSRGWVHCGYEERFLYSQGYERLLALGVEQKLLPASIINQEAKRQAAALEAEQGHPVGRAQMRQLKARITDELRVRALSRQRSTHCWFSGPQGLLAVNAASPARAEELVETLRGQLGSLPVQRIGTVQGPAEAMANWLTHAKVPGNFSIDQFLELQSAGGAMIRYARHTLDGREIKAHLAAGMLPTQLGLVWDDRIAFVLHRDMQIKRIQFLDVYKDDNAQGENRNEQFDIDFALMSGELTRLIHDLIEVLGGEERQTQQGQARLAMIA